MGVLAKMSDGVTRDGHHYVGIMGASEVRVQDGGRTVVIDSPVATVTYTQKPNQPVLLRHIARKDTVEPEPIPGTVMPENVVSFHADCQGSSIHVSIEMEGAGKPAPMRCLRHPFGPIDDSGLLRAINGR